jgi:hypothetical protein
LVPSLDDIGNLAFMIAGLELRELRTLVASLHVGMLHNIAAAGRGDIIIVIEQVGDEAGEDQALIGVHSIEKAAAFLRSLPLEVAARQIERCSLAEKPAGLVVVGKERTQIVVRALDGGFQS